MKTKIITARISKEQMNMIDFLKSTLHLNNTTSVLNYAVKNLYEITKEQQSQKSSFEIFKEKGLLGCIEGSADLSANYKNELTKVIKQKQPFSTDKKTRQKK